jgi:hypothetical protein
MNFSLTGILPPGPQTSTTYALGPNYIAAPLNPTIRKRGFLVTPYPNSFAVGTSWECSEYVTINRFTQQAPSKFNFDWQVYVPGWNPAFT